MTTTRSSSSFYFFFFQAEDGIRDLTVTGVQTCALPIYLSLTRTSDADGILWAKEVEDYQRFGVIVTDRHGYMKTIVEKPSTPVSKLANIGLYYVKDWKTLFDGIAHVLGQPPGKGGEYYLTDAFQYMVDRGRRLYTAPVGGWDDCGKVETLLETNR